VAKCENCDACSPKIRQNNYSKIFQTALPDRARKSNRAHRIRLRPAASADAEAGSGSDEEDDGAPRTDRFMTALEVEAQVRATWTRSRVICGAAFGTAHESAGAPGGGWTVFFLRVVAVPPPRFRPPMRMGGMSVEHAQNLALTRIMELDHRLRVLHRRASGKVAAEAEEVGEVERNLREADKIQGSVVTTWIELQTGLNTHFDSSKDPVASTEEGNGIRQLLEKKEGMFRKHMMGKRVNYACRSVISPDPYIGANEIGIPLAFAKTLTYPAPVTPFNAVQLRRLVANGPHNYPGAVWVEEPDGRRVDLSKLDDLKREAIANRLLSNRGQMKVGRQMANGDMVLMNRQPTLHKPGIMAHRVRVLHSPTQQTIRMHYANCNTYNADFDGDEMNCHLPQDDLARSEAENIVATDLQYIVPTDGSPLRGLIQDHVDGGVKMCGLDCFFARWEYQQLLFATLASLPGQEVIGPGDDIIMVPPAVRRPQELWTGKQVVTTLLQHLRRSREGGSADGTELPGISVEFKTKTPPNAFGEHLQEHLVIIRDGELLRGVLDKNAFGAKEFSLVHMVQEAYGPRTAGLLLNALGRLFTAYLQYYAGHSCRMEDLVLTPDADAERRRRVQRAYNVGSRAAKAWADSDGGKLEIPDVASDPAADLPLKPFEQAATGAKIGELLNGEDGVAHAAGLDSYMQSQVNPLASEIIKCCLPHGLAVQFPHNTFSLMVNTGAKGSIVNQSQVSCALGQQALEGRRVPRMPSGKTLPSFAPYDPHPRSDGFITDRFLTGIRPQEYYFHCMSGREGLVDTAVKTSRSGYLQRCLIKHLEDLKICYDNTVRDSDGGVVQFLYGEDGIDPTKAAHLECSTETLQFMIRNAETLKKKYRGLPDSTLDMAQEDVLTARATDRTFTKGVHVRARKLQRDSAGWVRGNIRRGWHDAVIRKVLPHEKFTIKYADGTRATLPLHVTFDGCRSRHRNALSSTTTLLRHAVPDPLICSPQRGHRLGTSGACVSEHVAAATHTMLADDPLLRRELRAAHLRAADVAAIVAAKYGSALCAPGEAVGCIAGQSVGEPSTQMTLNTFHLAGSGANVTLGIPRLREIIMTASRNLSTPTMSVPVRGELDAAAARRLMHQFTKLTLRDLLASHHGISVREGLQQAPGGTWERAYQITLRLQPEERIHTAFGLTLADVAQKVSKIFTPAVAKVMKNQLRKINAEGDVANAFVLGGKATDYIADELEEEGAARKKKHEEYDDEDANDEDGVMGDRFSHKKEMTSYGAMDDEDREVQQSTEKEVEYASSDDEDAPKDTTDHLPFLNSGELNSLKIDRANNALVLEPLCVDPAARPLLMVELIEKAAATTLVKARAGIDEAYLNTEPDRGRCLQTMGCNFEELWDLDHVDHARLLSNDIWAVRCAYGVEAARSSIMEQIRSVFAVYGISVDPRHLMLIADYMTYDGDYKPMNRYGMGSQASEFLKMSYETTVQFLMQAALAGTKDTLTNPSSSLVLGQPITHGTGAFECVIKT